MTRALTCASLCVAALAWLAACDASSRPQDAKPADADLDDAGLDAPSDTSADADASPDAPGGELRYELRWKTDGVSWDPSTQRFTLTNNLGVLFEIDRGYLVNYSAELTECDPDPEPWGWRLLSLPRAWAGHAEGSASPSAVWTQRVERLGPGEPLEFGRVQPPAQRYCGVHYLVARANPNPTGEPDDLPLEGVSLYLEGRAQHPGGLPQPFVVQTGLPVGVLTHLYPLGAYGDDAQALALDTAQGGATVRITRDLAAVFQGADPATMSARTLERHLLGNLADSATLEILPLP